MLMIFENRAIEFELDTFKHTEKLILWFDLNKYLQHDETMNLKRQPQ